MINEKLNKLEETMIKCDKLKRKKNILYIF